MWKICTQKFKYASARSTLYSTFSSFSDIIKLLDENIRNNFVLSILLGNFSGIVRNISRIFESFFQF